MHGSILGWLIDTIKVGFNGEDGCGVVLGFLIRCLGALSAFSEHCYGPVALGMPGCLNCLALL